MRFVWNILLMWGFWSIISPMAAIGRMQDEQVEKSQSQDQGTQLLEKAFELSASATSVRDLDQVVNLCEQALKAGLDEKETEQANTLLISTLMSAAEDFTQRIFAPERDRRWRIFRREALSRLEKVLALKPDMARAHLLVARLHMLEGGDLEKASAAVEKAIEMAGADKSLLSQALVARSSLAQTDEDRLSSLSQAVKIDPDNFEAILLRGMLYLKLKRYDEALADSQRMMEMQPNNFGTALLTAEIMIEMERNDEAIEVLSAAIERHPEKAALYSRRARLYLSAEKMDQAMNDAEEALKLDKNDIEALYVRVSVYAERKQFEDALRDIEQILKLDPNSVRGIWVRSIVFAQAEKYEESLRDLRLLTANSPDVEMFQLQLAAVLNADEQAEEAIEIYNRILEENPDHESALRGRGDARLTTGQHAEAVRDYERALTIKPDDDGVLNNLSWVLSTSPFEDVRDGQRAVELALKACELTDYKQAHILSTLAAGYAEIGDFDNALKWSEKAVELASDEKQRENLSKELASYKEGKPWREYQPDDRKKKKKPTDASSGDKSNRESESSEKDKTR